MDIVTEKKCNGCGQEKQRSDFNKDKQKKDGISNFCKRCRSEQNKEYVKNNKEKVLASRDRYRRANMEKYRQYSNKYSASNREKRKGYRLFYKYGISQEQYDEMLDRQKGVCKVCGKPEEGKALAVDHNHHTGQVRGLLCSYCNQALGLAQDSLEIVKKMVDYLEEYEPIKEPA